MGCDLRAKYSDAVDNYDKITKDSELTDEILNLIDSDIFINQYGEFEKYPHTLINGLPKLYKNSEGKFYFISPKTGFEINATSDLMYTIPQGVLYDFINHLSIQVLSNNKFGAKLTKKDVSKLLDKFVEDEELFVTDIDYDLQDLATDEDYLDKITDRINSRLKSYNIEVLDNEVEGEKLTTDEIQEARAKDESSAFSKVRSKTKAYLETFPYIINGELLRNPQANSLPQYHTPYNVFNALQKHLSGIQPILNGGKLITIADQFDQKLSDLENIDPMFSDIRKLFNENQEFQRLLIQSLNLSENERLVNGIIRDSNGAIDKVSMEKSRDDNTVDAQLIKEWLSRFTDSLVEVVDGKNVISQSIVNDIKSQWKDISNLSPQSEPQKNNAYNKLLDLYKSLGLGTLHLDTIKEIHIDDNGNFILGPLDFIMTPGEGSIRKGVISLLDNKSLKSENLINDIKEVFTTNSDKFGEIAKIESSYKLDMNDNSVKAAEGKKSYKYSPASQVHRMINRIKAGDTTYLNELKKVPVFKSNALVNWLSAIDFEGNNKQDKVREQRAKDLQLLLYHTTYNNDADAQYSDLTEADLFANLLINAHRDGANFKSNALSLLQPADKKRNMALSGIDMNLVSPIIDGKMISLSGEVIGFSKTGKEDFVETNIDIMGNTLLDRFMDERGRIFAERKYLADLSLSVFESLDERNDFDREDNDAIRSIFNETAIKKGYDLIQNYHVDGKNGMFGSYKDAMLAYERYKESKDYNEFTSTIFDQGVSSGANAYRYNVFNVEEAIKASNKLSDNLPQDEVDKINDDIKRSLLNEIADIFEEYIKLQHEYGNTDSELMEAINKDMTPLQILANSFWNQTIFNLDSMYFFTGDPAYFKTNPEKQFTDYTKRVQQSITDGLYMNITKEEDLYYTAAIVEDIEEASDFIDEYKKNLKPSSAKVYENINKGDAFCVIRPERARFILKKIGKMTNREDKLFDMMVHEPHKMTEKDYNDVHDFILKPLKGVNGTQRPSSNIRMVPGYFKYAQFIAIPGLSKEMDSLLESMEKYGVDEMVFNSGMKNGATNVSKIARKDSDGVTRTDWFNTKLNPIQYSNLDYKIQQDLPNKGFKEQMLLASQIQKNILSGLNVYDELGNVEDDLKKRFTDIYGEKFNDSEVLREIFDVTTEKMRRARAKTLKKFGFNENLEVIDKSKLVNAIALQLKDEVTPENIEVIRRTGNIDSLPFKREKLVTVIMSAFNKDVTNLKMPGASLIQASGLFSRDLTQDETSQIILLDKFNNLEELQPPLVREDGSISKGQILIGSNVLRRFFPQKPGQTTAEYIKDFNKAVNEGVIDPKILESVIGYRIPNQAMSSNDALEIVGILPPSMGDSIILYDDITGKTGSDFDIDKMYMMFPEVEVEHKNLKSSIKDIVYGRNGFESYIANRDDAREFLEDEMSEEEIESLMDRPFDQIRNKIADILFEEYVDGSIDDDIKEHIDSNSKDIIGVKYVDSRKEIDHEEIKLVKAIIDLQDLIDRELQEQNLPDDFESHPISPKLGKYELFPGVFANEQQKNAIDSITNHLNTSKNPYLLEGKGGTGKTTIITKILEQHADKRIAVAALSHKAVGVIRDSTSNLKNVKSHTLASLFGNKATVIGNGTEIFKRDPYTYPAINDAEIVVIDEASMITEEHLVDLMHAKKPIIFMGDSGQLPPIRNAISYYLLAEDVQDIVGISDEDMKVLKNSADYFNELKYAEGEKLNPKFNSNNIKSMNSKVEFIANKYKLNRYDSPVFRNVGANKSLLTERMRQGEESPILPYADFYWDNSHEDTVKNPVPDEARKSVVNDKGTLQFTNIPNAKNIIFNEYKKAIKDKDPSLVKIVTYRNNTRRAFNKAIRDSIGFTNDFNVGEHIIITEALQSSKIKNSTEAVIVYSKVVKQNIYGVDYDVYKLGVKVDEIDDTDNILNIDTISPKDIDKFQSHKNLLWRNNKSAAIKLSYNTFNMVDYSYAITSHKAQGSTYNTVIVDEQDIMSVSMNDNKQKSQSMYVAITRAKNNVIILDGSNNKVKPLNASNDTKTNNDKSEPVDKEVTAKAIPNTKSSNKLNELLDSLISQSEEFEDNVECPGGNISRKRGGTYSIIK